MRRELSRRPLLLCAGAIGCGLAAPREPILLVLLAALIFLAETVPVRAILVLLACIGAVRSPHLAVSVTEAMYVQGLMRVVTVPRVAGDGELATVEIGYRRLSLFITQGQDLGYGDVLRVSGVARPLKEVSERFSLGQGVVGTFEPVDMQRVERGPAVLRLGRRWRDSFRSVTASTLSDRSKRMADALCFNVESALDPELEANLRRTGTIHIVSASGLHVGIFALFLQNILSRLPLDRRWQLALLLFVLLLYVGATGMRPPVVRATLMAAVMLGAYTVRREPDLLSALGLAAALQMAIDPWSVFSAAFHLSCVAILGLGLFVRFEAPALGLTNYLRTRAIQVAHASLVATLSTAPVIGWMFGSLSIISVLANLLVTPFVVVIVPLSLVAWSISFMPGAATVAMLPVEASCRIVEAIVGGLGSLPFAAVGLPAFSAWWIPVWYIAMLGLWRKRVRPA